MIPQKKQFHVHLKYERERRGWSQAKVAREIGTDPVTVSRWERDLVHPSPHFRERLLRLFEMDAAALGLVQDNTGDITEPDESTTPDESASISTTQPATPMLLDPSIPLLPTTLSPLIGREHMLTQLISQLCQGGGALSAVHGLPGAGKTALALAVTQSSTALASFRDGILWARLGTNARPMDHLQRWGSLLGITTTGLLRIEEWAKAIKHAIGTRRMLIILDDVWQAEDVMALQVGGPYCAHLVTTRLPFVAVHSAGKERTLHVGELHEDEGVTLLARFAPVLVQHYQEAIRSLVRRVGGLPLALSFMGSYLQLADYTEHPRRMRAAVERLQDASLRLHLSQPQPLVDVHPDLTADTPQTLQALIALSEQCLPRPVRDAFRALAALPSKPETFSEEIAEAAMNAPVEMLDMLYDAGLLESCGPERYCMHPVIADYARLHIQERDAFERLLTYDDAHPQHHPAPYALLETEETIPSRYLIQLP